MIKRWRYIIAGITAIALGFLYTGDAQAKYVESKTLTIELSIEKHYEVAFNANGGTGSMANQQFTAGTEQALTTNTYTNGSRYFTGWNTLPDGTGTPYADGELIRTDLTNIGGDVVTLYAQWGSDAMRTVFKIDGECVFHGYDIQQGIGDGHITGTNCIAQGVDWADGTHTYIDTGVKLYDSTHYENDYEVGFTITAYDYSHQYQEQGSSSQATFFNAKLEKSDRHWPGITIRKNTDKVEITQTITKPNGSYEKKTATNVAAIPMKVVITRVDGIVYYSINDNTFTSLQDNNNTMDYFDVNAWFGAAARDNGNPFRYVDATMTNMYIKIGDKGANKHTVSFDAGGVTANPSDVTVIGSSKIGSSMPSMPNYVDTPDGRLYFIGWYTGANGTGEKYTGDTIVSHDMTLHAFWNDELLICRVGSRIRGLLQTCIDEASTGDTITLLDDLRAHVTVASDRDITLDLNGHKLSDNALSTNPAVIENSGKLTVINGTITSSLRAGVINNNATGDLRIGNGARILATGSRQAIYNVGGKLEIGGDAYLSATSSERAAVQNLDNGILAITGGTIVSTKQEAVKVESGTLTIGVEDGTADKNTPILQGATYGLNTSVDVSIYDGTLRGKSSAINNTSRITVTEAGATAIGINPVVTEVVDGITYKIIYYQ